MAAIGFCTALAISSSLFWANAGALPVSAAIHVATMRFCLCEVAVAISFTPASVAVAPKFALEPLLHPPRDWGRQGPPPIRGITRLRASPQDGARSTFKDARMLKGFSVPLTPQGKSALATR